MNKQEAVEVLRGRVRSLPFYNVNSRIVLFEVRNGAPFVSYWSPEEAQAVELVVNHMPRMYDSRDNALGPNHTTYYYVLDGDIELWVSYTPILSGIQQPDERVVERVQVGRRRSRLADYKNYIYVALRIHTSDIESLPASAGIVARQQEYTIVVPEHVVKRCLTYEEIRSAIVELQEYLRKEWVNDTMLVCRIPEEKETRPSRTGKTYYRHKVTARNSVAGYAEWVLEFRHGLSNSLDATDFFTIRYTNPSLQVLREFRVEGIEVVDALLDRFADFQAAFKASTSKKFVKIPA